MFTNNGYRVFFGEYAGRHYVKDFEKKYKNAWTVTKRAVVTELRNVDLLVNNGRTNPPIHMLSDRSQWILKHEFAIAGTRTSRKASGCRLIAHIDENKKTVTILLVYHKSHVGKSGNETAWWQETIRAGYKRLLEDFNF